MASNPSEDDHPIKQPSSFRESFTRPSPSSRISFVSDFSSPDLYDPEIRRQGSRDFVSPQASLSDLQSHRYDLPDRDGSDVSHVQILTAPGSSLDQPRSFSANFLRMPESQSRGPTQSPSMASNPQRYSWDRYEPLSPVEPTSRANTGLTGRLRSIRSIGSNATRRLSRHLSIPEDNEIDMGLIGNAYGFGHGGTAYQTVDEHEHGEELDSLGVDISNFLGPESPHDAATVLKYRQLESDGHLTGGLGSGLKPDITIRSTDLLAAVSPTSPLELSRGLSRAMSHGMSKKGSVLGRAITRHDLGQREANKTGKIIEVLVEDGAEGSGPMDLSAYTGEGTPPVEFDPLRNRQPTLNSAKEIYYPQPNWKPHSMRWPYLTALITVSITLAIAQEILYQKSSSLASQSPPSGLFQFTNAEDLSTWDYFSFKYLPTMIAVTYGILWQVTDYEVKRLEPFHRLSKEGGALAAESINIDYITVFNIFRPFRALRYRHYAVAVSSFATILAVSIVPTLQTASIVLEPAREIRSIHPDDPKFINIHATWSRVLTGILSLISVLGITLLIQLQTRRSGLAGDVRGIAGIAALATKSHVLMDFKDLDTVPPQDIHNKLKKRRYTLRNSSLASEAPMMSEDTDKYDRFRLSANPHPLMLRLTAGGPFILSMIAFSIFVPLVIFSPAAVVLEQAGWLLTLLAVAIKIGFQTLEQDARLMEPFYRLSCRHAPPRVLTLDYTTMVFGYMPVRAAINGDYLIALVGLGSVLAEILTVCVVSLAAVNTGFSPNMIEPTKSSAETPRSFWVSFSLSILILIYLIITASFVYKLRRHSFLPRQPSTIASVLAFIHQSKMLYDFIAVPAPSTANASSRPPLPQTSSPSSAAGAAGAVRTGSLTSEPDSPTQAPPPLRHGIALHAAQTQDDQDLLVKRLTDMNKTYGLGWFIGRDGETHCGVDQEELKGGYKHKMGDDARKATITGVGGWDYL